MPGYKAQWRGHMGVPVFSEECCVHGSSNGWRVCSRADGGMGAELAHEVSVVGLASLDGLFKWVGAEPPFPLTLGTPSPALPSPPPPPPPHPPSTTPCPQVTFVPPGFTRKPPKYERFIRPTGLRMNKAHVTHPELKATFQVQTGLLAVVGGWVGG